MEFQREALENVQTNTELLKKLNYTARGTLREAQQALNTEDVNDAVDAIHEQTNFERDLRSGLWSVFESRFS